jgi:hypothetical protein
LGVCGRLCEHGEKETRKKLTNGLHWKQAAVGGRSPQGYSCWVALDLTMCFLKTRAERRCGMVFESWCLYKSALHHYN